MQMQLTWQTFALVLPLVFFAAVVDAIGGGGGLISLPAYTLAGLDYGMASGCNKFSACFGTMSAVARFWRSGKILWRPAICAAAGALPGAVLGTRVSLILGSDFMRVFMLITIPVVAAVMLLHRDEDAKAKPVTRKTLFLCVLIGIAVGFYDGFFGPGTGTFLILLFKAVAGMDMVTASASSKPVNLASNISSLITRIAAGQVIFALALPAMVCSILGGQVGSRLALTRGARFIRVVMLFVLALLIVKLVVELLQ